MLLAWIEQGAPYNDEKLPKLASVEVLPPELVAQKGQTQQLAVTAVYADGTKIDVTRLAAFHSTDAKLASVDADGKVTAVEFGSAAIVAIYLRQAGVVRVQVPQPLPTGFPAVTADNKIDELVFANLKALGFPPSEVVGDDVFLRRVFFDVIGTPPTPEEAREFLTDKAPQKRSKLIDRLLEREEFADFLATKWRDLLRIKAEQPISLWPKASETYYRWVRDSILQNKPYDQFARELLTGSGSNFRDGPSNYVRAVPERDPRTLGEATALLFLGAHAAEREGRGPLLPLPVQAADRGTDFGRTLADHGAPAGLPPVQAGQHGSDHVHSAGRQGRADCGSQRDVYARLDVRPARTGHGDGKRTG